MNFSLPSKWIDASKENPDQWSKESGFGYSGEGRHRVKLQDGREIFTWWYNGQWSVERIKPHLNVEFWKRPVIIA